MSSTSWVRLNDGREFIVKISPEFIDEAAENEELIPALDGTLVPMVEVDQFSATRVTRAAEPPLD